MKKISVTSKNEIVQSYFDGLLKLADTKVKKYCLGNADWVRSIIDFLFTCETMASQISMGAMLSVGNGFFSYTDYLLPEVMVRRINAGKVYLSKQSVNSNCDPIQFTKRPETKDWEATLVVQTVETGKVESEIKYTPKLLTPMQVARIAEDWNGSSSQVKLTWNPFVYSQVYLTEFTGLILSDAPGYWTPFENDGRYTSLDAKLAGIVSPYSAKLVKSYELANDEEFALWLVGHNSAKTE